MKGEMHIFIPSYHRAHNIKTARYFVSNGHNPKKIHVFIDSEADDKAEYEEECNAMGINLCVFDMKEARRRYDYVHRPSKARRSAGQARNMFQDYAIDNGIDFYVVMDDDTNAFEIKKYGKYQRLATIEEVEQKFALVESFMKKRRIGIFGLPQTGDYIGGEYKLYRRKVMNTTFYLMPYIYRGERGVQDNDTSMFVGVMNEGLFTGSTNDGVTLKQTESAVAKGGLTDLYHECKLLNKSLVCVIQFPSAIFANKQIKNGGRLHHNIKNRYLYPRIMKGERDNIAWDTYPEDIPFTNEPKNRIYEIE